MNRFVFIIFTILVIFGCSNDNDPIIQKKEIVEKDPYIYNTGTIHKGESLANSLLEFGIENTTVYTVVNKLDEIYNLRRSQPADSFWVKLDSSYVVHELAYTHNRIKTYHVLLDSLDQYYTMIDTVKLNLEVKTCSGEIVSSLYKAMIDAGESGALPVLFTQIFQWDIDFFIDPQKGDKFKVVYEQYTNNGKFVRYGDILAAQYISKHYDDIAYRYLDNAGSTKYYNDKGVSFQKAFLKSPLNYKRITSYFGKRIHPVTKRVSMHNGVDYAAAYGTPVEAVADGTVIKASWHPNHTGNTVIIRHSNGYKTLYGHLSKFGKYKKGMRVSQHDIVGYVGSTGRSTGNHLHYTIYYHDNPINPLKLKNVSGPPISNDARPQFNEEVDSLRSILQKIQITVSDIETSEESNNDIIEEDNYIDDEPIRDSLGMLKSEPVQKSRDRSSNKIILFLILFIIILIIIIIRQAKRIKKFRY